MPKPMMDPLQKVLASLRSVAGLPAVVDRVSGQSAAIEAALRDEVLAQIPAYRESRNPDVLPQLARHGPLHAAEIIRLLSGGAVGDFAFVREHARLRASQYFPLEAMLHAYRLGHKVFAHRLLEAGSALPPSAMAALADFTLEYTDAISTIASTEYVEQARRLAAVAVDEHAALLELLLAGYDESDRRVTAMLRKAGFLDGRQSFCIVLAHSVDPSHMLDAARARRLADTLDALVPATLARRLIDVRAGTVTMVLAAVRRVSGWTAPLAALSTRVAAELALAGNDVLVGISPDVEATAQIPAAHRRAQWALRFAHVGERVCHFERVGLRDLMLQQAAPALRDMLPPWQGALHEADRRLAGALTATLRAYAAASLNVLKAAARLEVHPNTIYARFDRIRTLTGLDPRSYRGLETLLLVVDAAGPAANAATTAANATSSAR